MANPNKWSKTIADNDDADGDIDFAEGQTAGSVNNSARALMQGIANWLDDTGGALTTGGSATAYTVTTNATNTASEAHAEGFKIMVEWHATNTGADPTIAVDGLTAKTIYRNDGNSLAANDLVIAERDVLVYDTGSNGYRVLGPRAADFPAAASETAAGIIEIATTAETVAGTDTERAVTPAGLLAAVTGKFTFWVPASQMISRTTNGAAAGSQETTTNKIMLSTFDFDDSTIEYVQFPVIMPKSWDEGTLTANFAWVGDDVTGDKTVVWAIQAVAFASDDAADTAFGSAVGLSAANGSAANDIMIAGPTAAMTVGNTPGAEELVIFQVWRNATDGSDNFTGDAKLLGVSIDYTINAFTDD